MENGYIDILGIYPGMHASKFSVREDSWQHFCDVHLNREDSGTCFLPCKDMEGDFLFVDMTKLLAFYVLRKHEKPKPKKTVKKRAKK